MSPVVGMLGKRKIESHNTSPTPTIRKTTLKPDITVLKRTLPTILIGKKTFITHVKLLKVNEDSILIVVLKNLTVI